MSTMDKEKPRKRRLSEPRPIPVSRKRSQTQRTRITGDVEPGGSDVNNKMDAKYSGMSEPPLIKQLKRILSEYPDNGQIIKELIQNAEDAGAREVKVIYDTREINNDFSEADWFTKFFKGPALCVTNDGLFTEDDWKGIKMIASSVKEDNRLKVGRFGMGFKSVFHMTDFPCIISDDQLLLIDPTGASDKINAEMKLKELHRYRGMNVEAFYRAFREIVGIDEQVVASGSYKGTVFWFPLREAPSDVSKTIYNKEKTMNLFMSFANDAADTLLFLCHLESVSLKIKNFKSKRLDDVVSVAVGGDVDQIRMQRREFRELVEGKKGFKHDPISSTFKLPLVVSRKGVITSPEWLVIHYYMGNNSSQHLQDLILDPDLGFVPLVGIALPLNKTAHEIFESRIFCFLPLPKEGSIQTGLPVHVNAFFALNQSRHHLKWSTDDQTDQNITDLDIKWNQLLIDECLIEAYKRFIVTVKDRSNEEGNSKDSVDVLYRLIPNEKDLVDKWKRVPTQMRQYLNTESLLYSFSKRKFVTIHTAQFAMLKNLPAAIENFKATIIETVEGLDVPYVYTDAETFDKLAFFSDHGLNDLTPESLADLLARNQETLMSYTDKTKHAILNYLFTNASYAFLGILPLIHVSSDEWKTLDSHQVLYLCSNDVVSDLFQSFRNIIVARTGLFGNDEWDNFCKIASDKEILGMQWTNPSINQRFLLQTLKDKVGTSYTITETDTLEWLKSVWSFIDHDASLIERRTEELRLVPEIKQGSWENPKEIVLHPMSSWFVLNDESVSSEVLECFNSLGVTLLPGLPEWIPKQIFEGQLFTLDEESVDALLNTIGHSLKLSSTVQLFNDSANARSREAFVEYLCRLQFLSKGSIALLKRLHLFHQADVSSLSQKCVAVADNVSFITTDIPVRLPKTFIKSSPVSHKLLVQLGATETSDDVLVELILRKMGNNTFYKQEECDIFMHYFLKKFGQFDDKHTILELARNIAFLTTEKGERKKPDELFNPKNEMLKDLFLGESKYFPILKEVDSESCKLALKRLGLMEIDGLRAYHIVSTASLLDTWADSPERREDCKRKSTALLSILNKNAALLQQVYQSKNVLAFLKDLRWVAANETPSHFPSSLSILNCGLCKPFDAKLGTHNNECLVGATIPLIKEGYGTLETIFEWNVPPSPQKVAEQLELIKTHCTGDERRVIPMLITDIYTFLSGSTSVPTILKTGSLIWTGKHFESPGNIVIESKKTDIESLEPYFYTIPVEFREFSDFFEKVGCHRCQSVFILQKALGKIKEKHEVRQTDEDYEKDCQLTSNIIAKLAERRNEFTDNDILLPIQTVYTNRISFLQADKCTADKNGASYEPAEGDDSIVFVSDQISVDIAKVLGAKPLNKQIFSGTESMGIEGFGQKEKLTDRLRKLVEEGYKDGVSVPKELIQNADDAGATVVKFLYDEREHDDLKSSHLFSPEMADCQGPSIFVYNNASFSKADFENITRLNGGTKESDTNKIGRFGLGFCSVYNLTDVPSFVSKTSFAIFDPHETHLTQHLNAGSPGIKVDFRKIENRKLLKIYKNQFEPFQNVFGFEIASLQGNGYDGTLFRFPLRTIEQADRSNISKTNYSRGEVKELLTMFIRDAGNMLLFTQNVRRIELHHLPRSSKGLEDQTLLFVATKSMTVPMSEATSDTILKRANASLGGETSFKEVETLKIELHITSGCDSVLPEVQDFQKNFQSHWAIAWETGRNVSLELSERLRVLEKRAVPLSAVAVPCDSSFSKPVSLHESNQFFYKDGRFFCFLPLPIQTGLNVHINGAFDVTSDRQRLDALTIDDKSSLKTTWNKSLLEDASVSALFTLLETLSEGEHDCYYRMWPVSCESSAMPFHEGFFKRIVDENRRLFYPHWRNPNEKANYVPFSNVVYLDPILRDNPDIGYECFLMLVHIGNHGDKALVDIPRNILMALETYHNISKSCISERDLLKIFIHNIQHNYWTSRKTVRIKLIVYALLSGDEIVLNEMKMIKCIPAKPNGVFKRPDELVDEEGYVSSLFSVDDEVFPHGDFKRRDVTERLNQLGMMSDTLPNPILEERCSTIAEIATNRCTKCALERCRMLMKYIKRNCVRGGQDAALSSIFADKYMLPVLQKPNEWQFSWYPDTDPMLKRSCCSQFDCEHSDEQPLVLVLGKPSCLFSSSLSFTGGTVVSMVDEDVVKSTELPVFEVLGVKIVLPMDRVIKHMETVASEYDSSSEKMYRQLHEIYKKIYSVLDGIQTHHVFDELKRLSKIPVILIGRSLYAPDKVVFAIDEECPPHLNKLPINDAEMYKKLYKAMGVRKHFSVHDICLVLKKEKDFWDDSDPKKIDRIIRLLRNLGRFKKEELDECRANIFAPDTLCVLYPIEDLVIAAEDFKTRMPMHIVHQSIEPALAEKLGAKHIKMKCYEKMRYGKPFGQREKLVTRLKSLLDAYPCDTSIIKELLQNADDAEATEINIIKDYRYHSTSRIFDETCAPLQGPSLCVYNDSYFSEDDLQGIQDLGEGSKRSDPTKTGQYGVGFNVVYHLTDTPTFMTKGPGLPGNGLLCIFDPTCKHLPGVESDVPGEQYEVAKLQSEFPDVLLGYLEQDDIFKHGIGTIFRLPLRTKESEISKNIHTSISIDKICQEITEELFETLLFIKNVKRIRISNVSSGSMMEEYRVESELSAENSRRRKEFFTDIKKVAKAVKHEQKDINNIEKKEIGYEIRLSDSRGNKEEFFVQIRFGFDNPSDVPPSVIKAFTDGNLGCLPLGGVAFRKPSGKERPSKAFCFLPLPGDTCLPVHLNGHFALDHESRRSLWTEGYKQDWNECLIKSIIVPAYIECIHQWQSYYSRQVSLENIRSVDDYHRIFPSYKNVSNDYWKLLISHLYSLIVSKNHQLFPVVGEKYCDWVALGKSGDTGLGYFNVLSNYTEHPKCYPMKLEPLLKRIGMKIVQTSLLIKQSMADSGIEDLACTFPDEVLSFIATFGKPYSQCNVGRLHTRIETTEFENHDNLVNLMLFVVKSQHFMKLLPNLPLLVTSDNVLRLFSKDQPVYTSEWCSMFPASRDKFIHSCFTSCLSLLKMLEEMKKECYIHELTLDLAISLIPNDYRNRLRVMDDVVHWDGEYPNVEWIASLWEFIYKESTSDGYRNSKESFSITANKLSGWCLLPAMVGEDFTLVKIKKAWNVVDINSYRKNRALFSALTKLPLPIINENLLFHSQFQVGLNRKQQDIYKQILGLVTDYMFPERLLECLYRLIEDKGSERISTCIGTDDDAISILTHFARHILDKKSHTMAKEKLMTLPLYKSIDGCFVQLNGNRNVVLIPQSVPLDGLKDLMDKMKIIFLMDISELSHLYRFLSLSDIDLAQLYAAIILPNITHINQNMWVRHIEYINMNRLVDEDQNSNLARYITNIAFIETPAGYKKCSQFYSHDVTLFNEMCDENEFLPHRFRSPRWMTFITKLGLVEKVTDEMLLRFARQIEISKDVKKSKSLSTFLRGTIDNFRPETLQELCSIHFVYPLEISKQHTDLFPQKTNMATFICIDGSAVESNWHLCWSTIPVLPFNISKHHLRALPGIQDIRQNIEVLKHIQNVTTELKKKINSFPKVSEFMEKMYKYLQMEMQGQVGFQKAKAMLRFSPLIHIPNENKMVCISDIVLKMPEEDELKPFVFHAPTYYGKYFELFTELGASSKLECYHCLDILWKVQMTVKKEPMFPNDLRNVKEALSRLYKTMFGSQNWGEQKLFLPNADKIMCESVDIVVCNDNRLKERIKQMPKPLNYFFGFSELGIPKVDPEQFVKMLPTNLRPKLLTTIVKEQFDTGEMKVVPNSVLATRLSSFIHSSEFILGICRILKKFLEKEGKTFNQDTDFDAVKKTILCINIREVSNIETILEYNGQRIPGTNESRPCFCEKFDVGNHGNGITFYFKMSPDNCDTVLDVICSSTGLPRIILQSLQTLPYEAEMIILALLRKYDQPEKVGIVLDNEQCPSLDFDTGLHSISAFPKPGTYVEEKLHPFLEQAFDTLFDESEFLNVALELDSDSLGDIGDETIIEANPMYIYVHILQSIEPSASTETIFNTKYIIDNGGSEPVTVAAFRLYRFLRRQTITTEITAYIGNTTQSYLPFDENSRRIDDILTEAWQRLSELDRRRLVRRLLLQWHPDKNLGHEDEARRIFEFIKECIQRLVSAELARSAFGSRTGYYFNMPRSSTGYYFNMFNTVGKTAKSYARAFRDNRQEYDRCHNTGNYSHRSASNAIVKDPHEAKRWMKQAKLDFEAALAFLDDAEEAKAHNWICYTCHQASEKAIKAACYATDANRCVHWMFRSHTLTNLANRLSSQQLIDHATKMELLVGHHTRMRYPDGTNRHDIPSQLYTKKEAEQAIEIAKKIIEDAAELV